MRRKTIYLKDEHGDWQLHKYTKPEEIEREFLKRGILFDYIYHLEGFVSNKVHIGNRVRVGHDVVIGYNTVIEDDCSIGTYSKLGKHVSIGANTVLRDANVIGSFTKIGANTILEDSSVGNHVTIGEKVFIDNYAELGNWVTIGDGIKLGMRAKVRPTTQLLSSLYIKGSLHSVTYVGNGYVCCGCQCFHLDKWVKKHEDIALGNPSYWDNKILKEYKGYMQQMLDFHASLQETPVEA